MAGVTTRTEPLMSFTSSPKLTSSNSTSPRPWPWWWPWTGGVGGSGWNTTGGGWTTGGRDGSTGGGGCAGGNGTGMTLVIFWLNATVPIKKSHSAGAPVGATVTLVAAPRSMRSTKPNPEAKFGATLVSVLLVTRLAPLNA